MLVGGRSLPWSEGRLYHPRTQKTKPQGEPSMAIFHSTRAQSRRAKKDWVSDLCSKRT
jgi:hypothetical protein